MRETEIEGKRAESKLHLLDQRNYLMSYVENAAQSPALSMLTLPVAEPHTDCSKTQ